jgi:YHS domain-containing protein
MIIRILLLTILLYLVFLLVRNFVASIARKKEAMARRPAPVQSEDLVQDPVCRRYIPESEAIKASVDGRTLHFCSRECVEKFRASGSPESAEGAKPRKENAGRG